ncbi:hypothetical protein [Sporomusa sp.]|uniref:hypothetical protein n=1 Tax=Sporomusa sp. TaxID=2078658 RepID=UPI002CE3EE27|nr:hypothetical protein [Sporomusa sp.]HWR45136.1 hypothetical protein [Sporomusa sp.]
MRKERYSMGIPGCFNHLGCFEVTLILRDFKTVTGKIVGNFDDRKKLDWGDKDDDHNKHDDCDKCDDHKKDPNKCCKPKVDVHVDVEDKCDFILLELTRDAESVSLLKVEVEEEGEEEEIEIKVANVKFKEKSCIVVNVCDIIYAGVNAEIDEEEIEIELCECPDLVTVSSQTTTVPTE